MYPSAHRNSESEARGATRAGTESNSERMRLLACVQVGVEIDRYLGVPEERGGAQRRKGMELRLQAPGAEDSQDRRGRRRLVGEEALHGGRGRRPEPAAAA